MDELPHFYGFEVSDELPPMLVALKHAIEARPVDARSLCRAIERVLLFLASVEGRTDGNCRATNSFLVMHSDWPADWDEAPEPLQDILFDMAGQLHDTVTAPEVAENFESTPEQLLQRLRAAEQCLVT